MLFIGIGCFSDTLIRARDGLLARSWWEGGVDALFSCKGALYLDRSNCRAKASTVDDTLLGVDCLQAGDPDGDGVGSWRYVRRLDYPEASWDTR